MRDNPALQHVPMAVGGEGMLVSHRLSIEKQSTYEARFSPSQRRTI
jgi:hypothetical protein